MDENTHATQADGITRRRALLAFGGVAATALGTGAWKVLGAADADAAGGPAGVASGLVSCVLTPEQTEGPYYLDGDKVRRNITEGRPGVALTLRLTVVDASTCRPLSGAAVDVWQCDASGTYSGVEQQNTVGKTFMRGIQRTNARGMATFHTVYPGWYRGSTVHVHVKVHADGTVVHTGQLYFPDRITDAVYRRSPYRRRPDRDTRNAGDSVYRNGGKRSLMALRKNGAGYVAALTMGVTRS